MAHTLIPGRDILKYSYPSRLIWTTYGSAAPAVLRGRGRGAPLRPCRRAAPHGPAAAVPADPPARDRARRTTAPPHHTPRRPHRGRPGLPRAGARDPRRRRRGRPARTARRRRFGGPPRDRVRGLGDVQPSARALAAAHGGASRRRLLLPRGDARARPGRGAAHRRDRRRTAASRGRRPLPHRAHAPSGPARRRRTRRPPARPPETVAGG